MAGPRKITLQENREGTKMSRGIVWTKIKDIEERVYSFMDSNDWQSDEGFVSR